MKTLPPYLPSPNIKTTNLQNDVTSKSFINNLDMDNQISDDDRSFQTIIAPEVPYQNELNEYDTHKASNLNNTSEDTNYSIIKSIKFGSSSSI